MPDVASSEASIGNAATANEEQTDKVEQTYYSQQDLQKIPLQSQTILKSDHKFRQKKFTQQKSILKNSIDRKEYELSEAKKQAILRRRRLFSHYRQYEQWRQRQFSYDPSYYRIHPIPIGQNICGIDYGFHGSAGGGGGVGATGAAFRKRRQYRRQFSCAERSREDSRDSRESASLHHYKSAMTDSTTLNATNKDRTDRTTSVSCKLQIFIEFVCPLY